MTTAPEARSHIALAADLPLEDGVRLYLRVAPHVGWAKVGLSLFVEHGPAAVVAFQRLGARVFLDLKLHDIPNTVELAAARAGALGVGLLTVHAAGGEAMLRAALKGAREGAESKGHVAPRVLAVTVLTSLSAEDVSAVGLSGAPDEAALRLARLAVKAGVQGLGPTPFLCTPGIRPAGTQAGDQSRAETPAFARRAGADLLVVGRPIHAAADPLAAARALAEEVSTS